MIFGQIHKNYVAIVSTCKCFWPSGNLFKKVSIAEWTHTSVLISTIIITIMSIIIKTTHYALNWWISNQLMSHISANHKVIKIVSDYMTYEKYNRNSIKTNTNTLEFKLTVWLLKHIASPKTFFSESSWNFAESRS